MIIDSLLNCVAQPMDGHETSQLSTTAFPTECRLRTLPLVVEIIMHFDMMNPLIATYLLCTYMHADADSSKAMLISFRSQLYYTDG